MTVPEHIRGDESDLQSSIDWAGYCGDARAECLLAEIIRLTADNKRLMDIFKVKLK